MLIIVSNTLYFRWVYTAYTKQNAVFSGVDTPNTKHYTVISWSDTPYTKQYSVFPGVQYYLF